MKLKAIFLHTKPLYRLITISFVALFLTYGGFTQAEDEPAKESQKGETSPNKGETSPQDETSSTEDKSEKQEKTSQTIERAVANENKKMSQRHREVLNYLKLYGRENEVIELSAQDKPFYGFFLQERSGNPQGAVLILHDIEQHGHWPELVAPLREGLPDNGWITFSIELPHRPNPKAAYEEKYDNKVTPDKAKQEDEPTTSSEDKSKKKEAEPEQQTAEANSNNEPPQTSDTQEDKVEISDNEPELPKLDSLPALKTKEAETAETSNKQEDPMQAYRDEVRARINSALDYLRSRGQLNLVIIGAGEAALWAADTASNLGKEESLALVIINAKTSPAQDEELIQKIANLELPVLDLITNTNQSTYNQRILTIRKGEMRHRNKKDYSQILLPQEVRRADAFASKPATDPAVRRIRGWLRSKAAGTSLKIPRSQAPSPKQAKKE